MSQNPRQRRSRFRRPRSTLNLWTVLAVLLLLAAYFAVLEVSRPHPTGSPLSLTAFIDLAEADRIRDARFLDQDGIVEGSYRRRDGSVGRYHATYFKFEALREQLTTQVLLGNRIPTSIDQQFTKTLVTPATVLIPSLILVVVLVYLILSFRQGTGLFSRSGARKVASEESPVTFSDVAGQEAAVTELRELSQFLSDPERFAALGARVPKGVLLYGPPGCGKTLVARALAGEAGASFYSISGSDFVELYVGVGASRVRDLFREARENVPAIVFIDELDSVGRRRGAGSAAATGSREEQEQALNQVLAEMDGFSPMQGIIVVGATNRPDVLDPALLRPGRFDRSIGLERADEKGRLEILSLHARGKPLAPDVDLGALAARAIGMTGADLANVVNEAGLLAARAGKSVISQEELQRALTRIEEAPERQRRLAMRDRSLGRRSLAEEQVSFADVAGVEDAIEELAEIKQFLGDPERFTSMGARIPRGYLLSGPPGCGKTLLARAVASESNAAFFSVAATEFTEIFVGEGAARVRDLFSQARSVAPAIVFIDEVDAIGARRGASVDGQREREQTLNQILIELDGFDQRAGVIVIAATNRPDILDPALIRPGRFDRTVSVDLPDRAARRAILSVHAEDKRLAADVDLDVVARLTRGFSGADLANVMNEAALLAARRGLAGVSPSLVDEVIERASLGISSRAPVLSDEERRMVAYHEAGHGLVARALPGGAVLHKLTVIPRGQTLGSAWLPEVDDRHTHSRSLLVERMATLLGGRVAEELVFGEAGDGAANDLVRVGQIARRMVRELGMSKAVGPLPYAEDGRSDSRASHFSEETTRLIDSEVRRLVGEAEDLARGVLEASREALDRVARALMERETLTLEDVEGLTGPPPASAAGPDGGREEALTGSS